MGRIKGRVGRGFALAAWLAFATVPAGCASLFQVPEVRLQSMRVVGLGLTGGTLEAGVLVSNPNRYALRTAQLSYDLELADAGQSGDNWSPLANGQLERVVEIPASDSVVVAVPIEFTWAGVGGAIRSLLERGTFDYRVSGALQLNSPIRRDVPYRRTGTLSVGR
jgi:LEA14-like dessication related protein